MAGLSPSTRYFYHVGTNDSWSPTYSFLSDPDPADGAAAALYPYTAAIFADVGESSHAQETIDHLVDATNTRTAFLIGDISYASGCESRGCTTWDAYMR
jgi:hypothetical protein